MRTETANAAQSPFVLLPAAYDYSLSASTSPYATVEKRHLGASGDVEMHDISASASAASPPSNHVSISCACQGHQLTYSVINSLTRVLKLSSLLQRNRSCLLVPPTPLLSPRLLQ